MNPDKDDAYWQFTFHEMAIYDLPAMIDFILFKTKAEKLTYFGHSQGTLQAFIGMSILPEYFNRTLNGMIALGPVHSLANIGSTFISLVAKTRLDSILAYLGFREFLPTMNAVNELSTILCDKLHIICDGLLELVADSNSDDDDQNKFNVFLGHFPSGTSLMDIQHFAQATRTKKITQFDFGSVKNIEHYGQVTPPEYDFSKIQNKICLFVGKDDKLATPIDNRNLKELLLKIGKLTWYKEYDHMGHLTFYIPKDFTYNEDIVNCINEFEKK